MTSVQSQAINAPEPPAEDQTRKHLTTWHTRHFQSIESIADLRHSGAAQHCVSKPHWSINSDDAHETHPSKLEDSTLARDRESRFARWMLTRNRLTKPEGFQRVLRVEETLCLPQTRVEPVRTCFKETDNANRFSHSVNSSGTSLDAPPAFLAAFIDAQQLSTSRHA